MFNDKLEQVKLEFETYLEYIPEQFIFVSGNNANNSYEDMLLMSKCKHMILTYSTFSVTAELLIVMETDCYSA